MKKNQLGVILTGCVVLAGFIPRLIIYAMRLSIDGGEYVRLTVLTKHSYLQILQLGHSIVTAVHDPYGILLAQKIFINLFGEGKLVIRFVPFLSSLSALVLFLKIKDWFAGPWGGIMALGLLALAPVVVIRSALLEPYSSDICVILLVYVLLKRINSCALSQRDLVLYSLGGGLTVWFSLPAIFVLTGGGLALAVYPAIRKQWQRLLRLLGIYLFWLANFGFYYFYALRQLSSQGLVVNDWAGKFLPQTWNLFVIGRQVFKNLYHSFNYQMGITPVLGLGLLVFGAGLMFRKKRVPFMILFFPLLVTIIASCMQKYPFDDRVLIFLFPAFFLMIGSGCEYFLVQSKKNYKFWLGIILAFLLLQSPLLATQRTLKSYSRGRGIEPVLSYIKKNILPGDLIYFFQDSKIDFLYYLERFDLSGNNYIIGIYQDNKEKFAPEVERLSRHKRVWIIFNTKVKSNDPLQRYPQLFEYVLQKHNASRVDAFAVNIYRCALYEF